MSVSSSRDVVVEPAPAASFPGSPVSGQRIYRTDRNIEYVYDGARWLCTCPHFLQTGNGPVMPFSANALFVTNLFDTTYDLWIESVFTTMFSSSLTGSAYWTTSVGKVTINEGTTTNLHTHSIQSGTNSNWLQAKTTVNAALGTTNKVIYWNVVKTGAPGGCYMDGSIQYRLIG